ncbi:unnamed protein product [Zymoseptoria tritici ST99CH_3D7]|uniref:F-box domain-containing protein n=1 Tax=Zymoseptoria tritici (strain ST99CH_3D7) TaxID=1276538 RepID=A0A1X7RLD0_ZYMT9|nr:unnamed protein product [Zymoseptoria tritici ST99CH_3D7]
MTTLLLELPTELLLGITERLPFEAIKSLSIVNWQLHRTLSPDLFRCVRFTNRREDCDIISTVVEKYGRKVEKLAFELHFIPGQEDDDHDDLWPPGRTSERYPPARSITAQAQQLLDGSILPHVSRLRVAFFIGDFGHEVFGGKANPVYKRLEPSSETRAEEQLWPWRATLNQAFGALATRKGLRTLELHDLIPRDCSTFHTLKWWKLVSHLEEVEIHLWTGHNIDIGRQSSVRGGYSDFLDIVGLNFFVDGDSMTRVKLVADISGPIGGSGRVRRLNPFQYVSMPKLLHLELENCLIDKALCRFLGDHSQQLKVLRLKSCFAGRPLLHLPYYTWELFFYHFLIRRPVLEELTVTTDNATVTESEEAHSDDQGPAILVSGQESEDVKDIRRQLLDGPNRRLWVYAKLDPDSGVIVHDLAEIVTNNKMGQDQDKYDELMVLVRQNREGSGNGA